MKIEIKKGEKYNYWTVIDVDRPMRGVNEYYLCRCKCGTEREVFRGSLLSHRSKSCGCKFLGVPRREKSK